MSSPSSTTGNSSDDFLCAFRLVLEHLAQRGSSSADSSSHSTRKAATQLPQATQVLQGQKNFKSLLLLHKLVSELRLKDAGPVVESLTLVANEAMGVLRGSPAKKANPAVAKELGHILTRPHLAALFQTHDDVGNRRYEPLLPEIPHEVDEDEGVALKIVRLIKHQEPLGATIKVEEDGTVHIARVMKGGVADRSGCIQVGDCVVEVNGTSVTGKKPSEIVKMLAGTNGTVSFKLVPAADETVLRAQSTCGVVSRQRLRALYSYSSEEDPLHPCPEAGLSFKRGDILDLLDSTDEHWWQVRALDCMEDLVGGTEASESRGRVGLVPSSKLQEKRWIMSSAGTDVSMRRRNSGGSRRLRKVMYETRQSEDFEVDEVKCYEPVSLLYPRPGMCRPLVLIGAPGVGRNELKRRMLLLNPDRFGTTVPHTSRAPKPGEVDGTDYHFASRADMERWIREGRFIEFGEYKGNIYGTLMDCVCEVLTQGRTPVLNPHPQALRLLRCAALKPAVVFVKTPPFPVLKETRMTSRARSTFDSGYSRGFTDEELELMIRSSDHLDAVYGHCFDYTLVNGSLDFAFRELCDFFQQLDRTPQWVPTTWIR